MTIFLKSIIFYIFIFDRPLARIGNVYFAQEKYVEAINQFKTSLVENANPTVKEKMHKAEKIVKERERLAYISPEIGEEERQKGNEFFKSGNYKKIFFCKFYYIDTEKGNIPYNALWIMDNQL